MCEALAGGGGRAPSQPATGWGHKRFPKRKGDWCFGKTICIMCALGTYTDSRNVYIRLNIPQAIGGVCFLLCIKIIFKKICWIPFCHSVRNILMVCCCFNRKCSMHLEVLPNQVLPTHILGTICVM